MHARRVVPRGDFLQGVPITLDVGKHAMLRCRLGRKVFAMGLLDFSANARNFPSARCGPGPSFALVAIAGAAH